MVVAFALVAVSQVAWAAAALHRPTRAVALVGAGLNAALVLAWLATRTVGLPLVESLREPEAAGLQDTVCAALGLVAAGLAVAAAVRPRWGAGTRSPLAAGAAAVLVVGLAVPALAADHAHGGGDHDHRRPPVRRPRVTNMRPAPRTPTTRTRMHTVTRPRHADAHAAGGAGHDHDIPQDLDHEPTEEQLADARQLVAETEAALVAYADVAAAEADGYVSIGDARSGVEHFINREHLQDEGVLDPSEVESLVYRVGSDGGAADQRHVHPAPWSTMDEVPDVAGNLTSGTATTTCTGTVRHRRGARRQRRCRPGGTQGRRRRCSRVGGAQRVLSVRGTDRQARDSCVARPLAAEAPT